MTLPTSLIDLDENHDQSVITRDLAAPQAIQNPALIYLRSLGSLASQRTMYSFLNIVAKMVGQSGIIDFGWGQLRRHHIHALIGLLRESNRAPATINTYLSALKGVALEAWTLGQMDTDSFQHIKMVKSVKGFRLPKGRNLGVLEIRALFSVCDQDQGQKGIRDAAILAVLIGCGLRRSEIVSINYEQVNLAEKTIRVLGKGNKERLAFLPRQTYERLVTYIDKVRGTLPGPLFLRIRRHDSLTSNRLSDQAIYHILDELRIKADVKEFAPHDLRRSFATMMLENGEDIITVKDAMGHSSVLTTQKYDRRSDSRLRKAADSIQF